MWSNLMLFLMSLMASAAVSRPDASKPVAHGNITEGQGNKACSQGFIWQNRTGVCCQPVFNCPPGYGISECTVDGGEDKCLQCRKDMGQSNLVSSLDMDNARCFSLRDTGLCPKVDTKPSPTMPPAWSCVWRCECRNEACYYGDDSCRCGFQSTPCEPGYTMNRKTGNCEKCPWYAYKNIRGCGPCTINGTLWRQGKPDTTAASTTTTTTTTQPETSTSNHTPVIQPEVKASVIDTEESQKEQPVTLIAVVSVLGTLVFIALVMLVVYAVRRSNGSGDRNIIINNNAVQQCNQYKDVESGKEKDENNGVLNRSFQNGKMNVQTDWVGYQNGDVKEPLLSCQMKQQEDSRAVQLQHSELQSQVYQSEDKSDSAPDTSQDEQEQCGMGTSGQDDSTRTTRAASKPRQSQKNNSQNKHHPSGKSRDLNINVSGNKLSNSKIRIQIMQQPGTSDSDTPVSSPETESYCDYNTSCKLLAGDGVSVPPRADDTNLKYSSRNAFSKGHLNIVSEELSDDDLCRGQARQTESSYVSDNPDCHSSQSKESIATGQSGQSVHEDTQMDDHKPSVPLKGIDGFPMGIIGRSDSHSDIMGNNYDVLPDKSIIPHGKMFNKNGKVKVSEPKPVGRVVPMRQQSHPPDPAVSFRNPVINRSNSEGLSDHFPDPGMEEASSFNSVNDYVVAADGLGHLSDLSVLSTDSSRMGISGSRIRPEGQSESYMSQRNIAGTHAGSIQRRTESHGPGTGLDKLKLVINNNDDNDDDEVLLKTPYSSSEPASSDDTHVKVLDDEPLDNGRGNVSSEEKNRQTSVNREDDLLQDKVWEGEKTPEEKSNNKTLDDTEFDVSGNVVMSELKDDNLSNETSLKQKEGDLENKSIVQQKSSKDKPLGEKNSNTNPAVVDVWGEASLTSGGHMAMSPSVNERNDLFMDEIECVSTEGGEVSGRFHLTNSFQGIPMETGDGSRVKSNVSDRWMNSAGLNGLGHSVNDSTQRAKADHSGQQAREENPVIARSDSVEVSAEDIESLNRELSEHQ